jgi:AcrR family transcriptional regulator
LDVPKTEQIAAAAEAVLYRDGFHATGIDRVIGAARVTPRTLYRHFRSKDDLVRAVLERREARYLDRFEDGVARHAAAHGDPLLACFDALKDWLTAEGDRGCMFLKALGEYGTRAPAIAEVAVRHKLRVLDDLRRRVGAAGLEAGDGLPEKLMLLMEGATALAPVLGPKAAADQARFAAADLLRAARREVAR